jgi:tetratricopeptide (TPR) repeat protein
VLCFLSRHRLVSAAVTLLLLARFGSAADPASSTIYRPQDPLNQTAITHCYNLDLDAAVQDYEKILQRHPNDPFAINHLLSTILVRELYRMGAMNTGDYSNDNFIGSAHRPADPAVKQRIKQLVEEAEKQENAELAKNPDNVDVLYARGVTRGQFALYTALVERAWFSALRNAVGARRDHERVLELDPKYTDAKLVVGAHNYVMGNLPLAVKVAVALAGLSGDKNKGLRYLEDCYYGNGEASVDAGVVLMVFLRREHRYDEALQIASTLGERFPRNYLFPLEHANILRAAGNQGAAEDEYRRVWQDGRQGKYGSLHYEISAIGLGDLLRGEKKYQAAAAAYEMVNEVKDADPELLQKANLAAGEMYDQLQQRDLAMKKYEAVVAADSGNAAADKARKLMKEAYRE